MARRRNESWRREREQFQKHGQRAESIRDQRSLVILACEGEKTERLYFEAWFSRLRKNRQISARSCVIAPHRNTHPTGVLSDLIAFNRDGLTFKDFERRWIVIDRDAERAGGGGHTLEDFNQALRQAATTRPKVLAAWSNPCFEIWYLLHYRFQNTGTDRDLIKGQLSRELGFRYDKSDPDMFVHTIDRVRDAIGYAKRLHTDCQEQRLSADQSNPCTTVYQLVEQLLKMEESNGTE